MRKTSVSLLPRGQWVCDKSRAFRVRKKEETLCLCVSAFEIYCFRHLKKQGKTNKNI